MKVALKSTRSSLTQFSRRSLNSNQFFYESLIALRKNTLDVELNGFKITAVDEDDQTKQKNLIFLHGLLGQGRNWRSFALNDVVCLLMINLTLFSSQHTEMCI